MKYATSNPRFGILELLDQPPEQPHIEVSDEQAEEITRLKKRDPLIFLVDGQIISVREHLSAGNGIRWDGVENKWDFTFVGTDQPPA